MKNRENFFSLSRRVSLEKNEKIYMLCVHPTWCRVALWNDVLISESSMKIIFYSPQELISLSLAREHRGRIFMIFFLSPSPSLSQTGDAWRYVRWGDDVKGNVGLGEMKKNVIIWIILYSDRVSSLIMKFMWKWIRRLGLHLNMWNQLEKKVLNTS